MVDLGIDRHLVQDVRLDRRERAGLGEHVLADVERRVQANRQRDRIGRARIDTAVADRSADREVGDEGAVLEVGHLDRVEMTLEALDQGCHEIVGHRARRVLATGSDRDRCGGIATHDDRQHSVGSVVLAKYEHGRARTGIDLDRNEVNQQHAIMIQLVSGFMSQMCPPAPGSNAALGPGHRPT